MLGVFIIDPQRDFHPGGALPVEGADLDANRAAGLILRLIDDIDAICVTMDTHTTMDISHPLWYADANRNPPKPYTEISSKDIEECRWYCAKDGTKDLTLEYLRYVESLGKTHIVWPTHCVAGTTGHAIEANIQAAITAWEVKNLERVDMIYKGDDPYVESFSAVRAMSGNAFPNHDILDMFRSVDRMLVFGQALSHCVAETCRDLIKFLPRSVIECVELVTDCTSPVPGFEDEAERFLLEWEECGGNLVLSTAVKHEPRY